MSQVPLAPPPPTGQPIDGWLYLLWKRLVQAGQILWDSLDFTGSNLTDLATRNHADLQNINTASYTHLSATNATDLTDGTDSTLHFHATDRALANITGLGTGVGAALAINVGSAGTFVVLDGSLGTPSSGTVTNLTGTASININGTVGATTPASGAFTTISATGATNLDAGTVGSPGLYLESETGTGLYRIGANNHGYSVSGAKVLDISSTGLAVSGTLSTSSTLTTLGGAVFHITSSALTDGAAAAAGTLLNAPVAGNPTKWIAINDNGVIRHIPSW